eukprot:6182475-Pleurochrysis_carterae.AAC.2
MDQSVTNVEQSDNQLRSECNMSMLYFKAQLSLRTPSMACQNHQLHERSSSPPRAPSALRLRAPAGAQSMRALSAALRMPKAALIRTPSAVLRAPNPA